MLVYVIIPSLAGALFFRGGLAIHLLGIAIVGRDGKPSRLRAVRRALVAWLPFLLSPMLVMAANIVVGANYAAVRGGGLSGTCNPPLALIAPQLAGPRCLALTWCRKGRRMTPSRPRKQPNPRMAAAACCRRRGCLGGLARGGCPVVRACAEVAKKAAQASTARLFRGEQRGQSLCRRAPEWNSGCRCRHLRWHGKELRRSQFFQAGRILPAGDAEASARRVGQLRSARRPRRYAGYRDPPAGPYGHHGCESQADPRLRLQPFGRVEGILLSEGKPKPGGNVNITLLSETHELYWSRSATADQDGHFVLTNLPAGEYQISRLFFPRRQPEGGFATAPSHQKILTVKAGETVQLQYGGEGRSVIGQAAPENPAVAVDWLNENQNDSLELVRPSAASGLSKFISESWGLGQSAAEGMQSRA